jgi:hypothetical protein
MSGTVTILQCIGCFIDGLSGPSSAAWTTLLLRMSAEAEIAKARVSRRVSFI